MGDKNNNNKINNNDVATYVLHYIMLATMCTLSCIQKNIIKVNDDCCTKISLGVLSYYNSNVATAGSDGNGVKQAL